MNDPLIIGSVMLGSAIVLLVVWIAVERWWGSKWRTKKLRTVAADLGLQFGGMEDSLDRIEEALKQVRFRICDPKHGNWRVRNVIHGQIQGVNVIAFDHQFWTTFVGPGYGPVDDWSTPHTLVCLSSDQFNLPAFEQERGRVIVSGRGRHLLFRRTLAARSFSLSKSECVPAYRMKRFILAAVAWAAWAAARQREAGE